MYIASLFQEIFSNYKKIITIEAFGNFINRSTICIF